MFAHRHVLAAALILTCTASTLAQVARPAFRVEDYTNLPPDQAYAKIYDLLVKGRQAYAEFALAAVCDKYPNDLRLAFFRAVCTRSRFDVPKAAPLFKRIIDTAPKSVEAQCATLILDIDLHRTPASLDNLGTLAKAHPDDPLLMWMAGIAARTLDQNEKGIEFYKALLEKMDPGPVLVHQTYANLLDGAGKFEQALEERNLAVKMEPASWSYQGLGLTLTHLEKFEDADKAFAKAAQINPQYYLIWPAWGTCLQKWQHFEDAAAKFQKAWELNPRDTRSLLNCADCLYYAQKLPEARDMFEKYRALVPNDSWACFAEASVEQKLGNRDRAAELLQKSKDLEQQRPSQTKINPQPAPK